MNILNKVEQYRKEGRRFALLTVVEVKGSSPQVKGAKMIVFSDGKAQGTIGGGKTEFSAIADAREAVRRNESALKTYDLTKKNDILCGGHMKVFIEIFAAQKNFIIVGAGHIGLALYKLGSILGFDIVVIDNRKEFANKKRFPQAKIKVGKPDKLLKKEKIGRNTYISIATHNHEFDFVSLKAVVKSEAKYIGMIGSKNKIKENFRKLSKQGIEKNYLKRVHAPIGLKLGGSSPEEIAVAILAQMQAVEYGQKGSLKFKNST